MTGASIETTLELWASSLRDVKGRMRGLASAMSSRPCAEPAKAMFSGLNRTTTSAPGLANLRSPAPRRKSHETEVAR